MTTCPARSDHLRILAFEPFDTGSHRAVRESITRHSRHAWTWITAPGRGWKWRMRLGAVDLVERARAAGAFEREVDAVFATSLLSLADLVALLPPAHRATTSILYMHENQAAYPHGATPEDERARDVHFALTNFTSILAADLTIWNSAWNRSSFRDGLAPILRRGPEAAGPLGRPPAETPVDGGVVIWPPVEPGPAVDRPPRVLHNAIRVVWPHRWEHDKGPDELLATAERYTETLDLRWTILGERFDRIPAALAEFERRFADRIDHMGYVADRDEYWRHLGRCDWVLSTARHEFFGIAVVEALEAGCLPWLPPRLSYPEILPPEARDLAPERPPANPGAVRAAIRDHLAPARADAATRLLDDAIARAVATAASTRHDPPLAVR